MNFYIYQQKVNKFEENSGKEKSEGDKQPKSMGQYQTIYVHIEINISEVE